MGVLPLEFTDGATRQSLGLTGFETYDIDGMSETMKPRATLTVRCERPSNGSVKTFSVRSRDRYAGGDATYYRHGGILPYVLRKSGQAKVV